MLKWRKLSQFLQGKRARLAPGERLYQEPFREWFREGDLHVRIDRSHQRVRLDAEDLGETFVVPTLPDAKLEGSTFVGAAELLEKARTFEEGVLAAVDLALQEGLGRFPGRRRFLEDLLRTLPGLLPKTGSNVAGVLYGAGKLSELTLTPPADLIEEIDAEVEAFLADPVASQPHGRYAWAESLGRIYRQDRILSRELRGAPELSGLLRSLRGKEISPLYSACLHLGNRFRGRPAPSQPDLQAWIERREGFEETPEDGVYLFPPHPPAAECLWWKLVSTSLPSSGVELGKEMAEALRDGLHPAFFPGWPDVDAWALSPLVCASARVEGDRAVAELDYRAALDDLFQAVYSLPRETVIKPLDLLLDMEMDVAFEEVEERARKVLLTPDLTVEPLPTLFLRRSLAYRALREMMTDAFGPEAMASLQRLRPEGPVEMPLLDELEEMAGFFRGAFAVSAAELGFTEPERRSWEEEEASRMEQHAALPDVGEQPDQDPGDEKDAARFRSWVGTFRQDPDLGNDRREMVPIGREEESGRIRVRAFLGWGQRVLTAAFVNRPTVSVTLENGADGDAFQLEWEVQRDQQAFPVTVELSVPRVLDPEELRGICDRHKTVEKILEHLG